MPVLLVGRALAVVSLCLISFVVLSATPQTPLRIAVLDFVGSDDKHSVEMRLASALAADSRVRLLDPAQISAAVAADYNSSLNLTVSQARQIGATIGCDAFFLG